MTTERTPLPDRRASWTQKVNIEGQDLYISFGEYDDGRLGEVFLTCAKTGTFTRGILDALARVVSVSLQYGVPVAGIVEAVQGLNFPPNGPVTGSQNVSGCASVTDYLAREVHAVYSNRSGT